MKFFEVVLNLPAINRRLTTVMGQLKSGQPSYPQLYIYSSAVKVIPTASVESFIAEQEQFSSPPKDNGFIPNTEDVFQIGRKRNVFTVFRCNTEFYIFAVPPQRFTIIGMYFEWLMHFGFKFK